ncbi:MULTISPECIES: radical SAM protein [unclassified Pseudodesulfovibrio]|uniref:radical SAM protein n=1 Tax=unclassified Pseudodesulfovibrio TaxID=2661612 RepID=UPI000FEB7629|nr:MULTISPECIES: radical SAM protein [unclassified Pseudodesulfovibrio]MCJ2166242.1 radical SAM protein [Pseudodesulfovibrio sp. S3-i]RWU02274.1 radical SAM protein [Pseudodesulfovibrio sp. S3]
MKNVAQPHEWLTDSGLTDNGRQARKSYGKFVSGLTDLLKPIYRTSRVLHLLQSHHYDTAMGAYALPPHTINFCINTSCNLKCQYCDLNHSREEWDGSVAKLRDNLIEPNKRFELPLDVCKKVIDQVAWFKPTIRIPWVEPLLYKDIMPFIEYTKSKDLPFSMLTNGLLLPKFAKRLAEAGIDALRVSLDGPREVHDKMCGVKGTFSKVIEGLKILVEERKKLGIDIQIGCYYTVTDDNDHCLVDFLEELEKEGLLGEIFVGFFMFNYISKNLAELHNKNHADICGYRAAETSSQFADISKLDVQGLVEQRKEIEKRFQGKTRINFRPFFSERNLNYCVSDEYESFPESRCDVHWHTLYINPQGEVKSFPQCFLGQVGNVQEYSVMDIWNCEAMRDQRLKLRDHRLYDGCKRCYCIYSNLEDVQDSWVDTSKK